jgi:hypothetical protein
MEWLRTAIFILVTGMASAIFGWLHLHDLGPRMA